MHTLFKRMAPDSPAPETQSQILEIAKQKVQAVPVIARQHALMRTFHVRILT